MVCSRSPRPRRLSNAVAIVGNHRCCCWFAYKLSIGDHHCDMCTTWRVRVYECEVVGGWRVALGGSTGVLMVRLHCGAGPWGGRTIMMAAQTKLRCTPAHRQNTNVRSPGLDAFAPHYRPHYHPHTYTPKLYWNYTGAMQL